MFVPRLMLFLLLLAIPSYASETQLQTGISITQNDLLIYPAIKMETCPDYNTYQQNLNTKKITINNKLSTNQKPVKQQNMSKQFGPLLMEFRINPTGTSAVKLNLDLVKSYEIFSVRPNAQQFYQMMQPDQTHYIISPQLRQDIKATWDKLLQALQNGKALEQGDKLNN